MTRNLEIKVSCDAIPLSVIQARAVAAGAGAPVTIQQLDTYFAVARGRLKLREIASEQGASAELIGYLRPDDGGSRWSDYQRVEVPSAQAQALRRALAMTCGLVGEVGKTRTVLIWGRTRIHLDEVDGLGAFVELETVAGPDDDEHAILHEHERVIRALGLDRLPVIAGSYGELIQATSEPRGERPGGKGSAS